VRYNAYLSGRSYEQEEYPTLDSIKLSLSHKYYQTNTTTVIEKVKPQKGLKVGLTPSITVGYDPFNKQWGAMVGVGLSIYKK